YLETNGAYPDEARLVAPLVDIVSMDIKLPSLCGGRDLFGAYEQVLPVFGPRGLFIKIVIAEGFEMDELERAAKLVAGFDSSIPLVIQPATAGPGCRAAGGDALIEAHSLVSGYLSDVRVIPQCHKLLGLK
ncbi:MAG TPA: hypothetical protein VLA34_12355, partial [Candidatus Krumholzibacterium sp.]|nr:hypothetical protein [Candidatus Krumholzibacterium sp.]